MTSLEEEMNHSPQAVISAWHHLRLTLWLNAFLLAAITIAIVATRNLDTSLSAILALVLGISGLYNATRISRSITIIITERQKTEDALRDSEERYRRLVEYSPNGILIHKYARFMFINRAGSRLFGVEEPQELLGKPILDYIHPTYRHIAEERGREEIIIRDGMYPVTEEMLKRLDGTDLFVEVSRIPFNYQGQAATQIILRDITERKLAESALEMARVELEQRVQERTAELALANVHLETEILKRRHLEAQITESLSRRTRQVQTNTEVAQEIATEPALGDMFRKVVHLVQARLGYYHAHVYTLENDYLVMQAGSGEPGQKMKAASHKILLATDRSLVAKAAVTGTAILVPDVSKEPYWLPNPLLPDTKSEVAAVIKLREEILGVLDVQSNEVGGLGEEDKLLLMGLCGQIAVAINSRQLEIERRKAQEQLHAYTLELERSNQALQDFAYVASHDLQEPLRKVQAFGDRLKTRYKDKLDDRGQDYLNRMQNAAVRMQTLINDLLAYSRVTTKAQPFTSVDLNYIVKGVMSDLEVRIEQLGATIHVSELPTIDADQTQMRQLLQNIIGNALKFHRPGVPPIVNVSSQILSSSQVCKIDVSDNGIGLEEKYQERIFQVFQRLHGRSIYEGTGVGLAICRKIVERHGGTIKVSSIVGDGTTFTIILPLKQPHPESVVEPVDGAELSE